MATEDEGAEAAAVDPNAEGAPETPVEGVQAEGAAPAVEKTPEEVAAEAAAAEAAKGAAAKKTPAEIFAELPEALQEAVVKKFANGTMAAARRAEARVEAVKQENTKLTGDLQTHREFVQQLRSGDPAALARVGFKSPREFLDKLVAFGGEQAAPSVEDRLSAFEKRDADEKAARERAATEARVETAKQAVFAAIDKSQAHPLTATKLGKVELWSAIEAYYAEHGECSDAAVWAIADKLEAELDGDVAPAVSKKISGQRQPANKGADAGNAEPASLNAGKTLTNKGSSGAPAVKEYSQDPDERRRQINADLKAEGLLDVAQ